MPSPDSAEPRYALSFTTGGLLVREAIVLAESYLSTRDWAETRRSATEGNALKVKTQAANQRLVREAIQRAQMLSDGELELLVDSSPTEQHHLMWAAVCRRYELIGEFAQEILRERFLLMTPSLSHSDFDRFITGKCLWHPELEALKPSTRQKLRQNVFRMLREADLRSDSGEIVPAILSERVIDVLDARTPSDLRFFPTTTARQVQQ